MISIEFKALDKLSDEVVKQDVAERQMSELITRLTAAKDTRHYTLSLADRQKLLEEGYAGELLDNLVFLTRRKYPTLLQEPSDDYSDEVIAGFTYAAFDSSLYSSPTLLKHLQFLNRGCCAYCETYLGATDAGEVSHFRPVFSLSGNESSNSVEAMTAGDKENKRESVSYSSVSPYFDLAYTQSNLLYACSACSQANKSSHFPVAGKRYPSVDLKTEKPLLINPYEENPRDFIRFNPLNGAAFGFDRVADFYRQTEGLSRDAVEEKLWAQPRAIPKQYGMDGISLSDPTLDQDFTRWLGTPDSKTNSNIRGDLNIHLLALNRTPLLLSRLACLSQLKLCFLSDKSQIPSSGAVHQYRSLAEDAFNTWKRNGETEAYRGSTQDKESVDLSDKQADSKNGSHVMSSDTVSSRNVTGDSLLAFPDWLRSSLMFYVPESELQQAEKRRLVCLSSKDKIYGANQKEKCVFLPINWKKDTKNVIKVKADQHIWETTFAELASSRPMEVTNLFANNHLWVEGDYQAVVG